MILPVSQEKGTYNQCLAATVMLSLEVEFAHEVADPSRGCSKAEIWESMASRRASPEGRG